MAPPASGDRHGRRRRVVLAPLGWCQVLQETCKATVTNKVMDTGESTTNAVNTIAQGRPVAPVEPVVTNSCAFYTAHEAAGATSIRSSLRPLYLEGP
jgi:hypothetical protein